MQESKLRFIKKYCTNPTTMKDLLYEYMQALPQNRAVDDVGAYKILCSINAHNTGAINPTDAYRFFKSVYDARYNFVARANSVHLTEPQKEIYNKFVQHLNFHRGNVSAVDAYNFFFGAEQSFLINGISSQSKQGFINNNNIYKDFIHVSPFSITPTAQCRLYVNLKAENVLKVSTALLKKCEADEMGLYFKFNTFDNRNDAFLIYTDYDHAEYFIQALKGMKQNHPEWFAGAENISPVMGAVDGFIGYGEEPVYRHSSFNSERAEIIDEYLAIKLAQERMAMTSPKVQLKNRYGQVLDLRNYIIYRTKENLKKQILTNIKSFENGNGAKFIGSQQKHIQLLQNLLQNFNCNIFPEEQIAEYADECVQNLNKGRSVGKFMLKIVTDANGVSRWQHRKALNSEMPGCTTFNLTVEADLMAKLEQVFHVSENLRVSVDEGLLRRLCQKRHVSYNNIALNSETEHEVTPGDFAKEENSRIF